MRVTVGTFNLNNLFSRFNFSGVVSAIQSHTAAMTVRYEFTDSDDFAVRRFRGNLVKGKNARDTATIAERILNMNVHVLAVQEIENIAILREFNRDHLDKLYPHQVLIEGNDPRLIDIGILSRFPIGQVASFQTAVHPEQPQVRVFGRDLLEVEILSPTRSRRLFTLYNTHLKSHFGDHESGGRGKVKNDARRRRQAEAIRDIISRRMRSNEKYIVVGDMNDGPDDSPIHALKTIDGNPLTNALADARETRPAKPETGGHNPSSPAWTYRHKKSGQPPEHKLYDQIWLSPTLAPTLEGAFIDRRSKHGGNGSDHDPAWVAIDVR